jgi:hypothetical protein
MESGTVIITIIFILIVSLPFILISGGTNRKRRKMLQQLEEMASGSNSKISEHEFCSDFVIGLDKNSNHLFYYKHNDNRVVSQHFCLDDYKNCKTISYSHNFKNKKEQYNVMDKMELCFYPYLKEMGEKSLDLYDDSFDRLNLTGELQFAEKWEKLLNERLETFYKKKQATERSITPTRAEKAKFL